MVRSQILRKIMNENNIKVSDISKSSGIAYSTVKSILENGTEKASYINICKICEALGITPDDLEKMVNDGNYISSVLSKEDADLLKKYRDLDDIGKTHVENVLEWETERVTTYKSYATQISDLESSSHSPLRLVRYYQNLASAGSGEVVFDDGPDERIEIPDIPEYRRVAYAITVNGHSMETLYSDGDTLLVEVTQQIDRGEVGIFIIGDRAFVKMLGETELISLNDEYSNIPLTEDTKCMGRVVGKM